ncbi:ribosomal maturation YjgA family protein [Alkaliphilus oremlandii]|uniref:DUF2809 domain-containing protein n=1 Tax=Alkaliphilus oremlandii (strain OhILAs) TaxID=350688 RepID=A8MG06_ALKOO|nr:DUF2809 domain-containing protein [Alkaliphilus oremlandii]ABW18544.1 conserved hypothetical protein [Alkaliphilus oremlandii OhILAs]
MLIERNRIIYFVFIVAVMILGLGSRYYADYLPKWTYLYFGDVLWALMIFLIFGFLFKRKHTLWIGVASFLFSFAIEFSQLYQASWINGIRGTTIGGLVLGHGFLWSDLFAYTMGIGTGILLEKRLFTNS